MLRILYATFFFVILFSCNSMKDNTKQDIVERKILFANDSVYNQIVLKNRGNKAAVFSLKWNDSFFFSDQEITQQIIRMRSEFINEPLERKAWRYVIQNIRYSFPLTENAWQHSPGLMINSIGNGVCDDLAIVLSNLWKNLGFNSRVWSLGGHVVPEVEINGKWQMYDPTYQVYYINSENEVAGVEELSKTPSMIRDPYTIVDLQRCNVISYYLRYSSSVADIYSSVYDNFVTNNQNEKANMYDTLFYIPKNATISFPVSYNQEIINKDFLEPDFSFLSVNISEVRLADLYLPLVLYAIEGRGKVAIDNNEFDITSDELIKYINSFPMFHRHLFFSGDSLNAVAYYLINKKEGTSVSNSLLLKGFNIDCVSVETRNFEKEIIESNSTNVHSIACNHLKDLNKFKAGFVSHYSTSGVINEWGEISERIKYIIETEANLSQNKKRDKYSLINKKISFLKNMFANNQSLDTFFLKISDTEHFIIFYIYCEYYSKEELAILLNHIINS